MPVRPGPFPVKKRPRTTCYNALKSEAHTAACQRAGDGLEARSRGEHRQKGSAMPGRFEGKGILVTGGGAGMGRAASLAFAREGARVTLADLDASGGEETARLIHAAGGEARFVRADVSRAADVEALITAAVATFGRLDCAFNNAGINEEHGPLTECSEERWDRILGINLKGIFLCMKYEIPQLLRAGGGAIVNNASVVGLGGSRRHPAYAASKHGVVGLTRAA